MTPEGYLSLTEEARKKTADSPAVMIEYGLALENLNRLEEAYETFRTIYLADNSQKEAFAHLDRINVKLQKRDAEKAANVSPDARPASK
jgi:predicted Zn-dependent protease